MRLTLTLVALLWAAALPLAASAAARSDGTASPSSVFALAAYQIGSLICHQRPDRSFHLGSVPLPVCARCTGIYVGAAITAVFAAVWLQIRREIRLAPSRFRSPVVSSESGKPDRTSKESLTSSGSRMVLLVAASPSFLTLVYEWTTRASPSNAARALAGLVLGAGVAWVLLRLE